MIVRRIGVLSSAKVAGCTYAAFGLVAGALVSVFSLMGMAFGQALRGSSGAEAIVGGLLGLGAIIFIPLFYGVMGFVVGALGAAVYNLVAQVIGGLEIELEAGPTSGPVASHPAPPSAPFS